MDTFPTDLLVLVAAHLDHRSLEQLVATHRVFYDHADERFYWHVACDRWGEAFWQRAVQRPTSRTFQSMRDELRILHLFFQNVRKAGGKEWTHKDFYAFWDFEAQQRRWVQTHLTKQPQA